MRYSIVIPVYNSETSIDVLYNNLQKYFKETFEVIFVNDCSQDDSKDVILKLIDKFDHVKLIDLKVNEGQQKAIYYGLLHVTGDYIVTMDDDLQHPIKVLDEMIKEIEMGKTLVYGIPMHQHNQLYRGLGSRLTARFFRKNYPELEDQRISSYRIFTYELVKKVLDNPYDFVYISALLLRNTQGIGNVFFDSVEREFGQSGYTFRKLLSLYLKLNVTYGKHPFKWVVKKSQFKQERIIYEKSYDLRSRSVSNECH